MNQKLQFYFTMILILRSSQRFSITGTEALFPKTETVTLADEITFESIKILHQLVLLQCTEMHMEHINTW